MGELAEANSSRSSPLLTLDRIWAILAIAVPFLAAAASRMATIDLAYQVRLGDMMLTAHHLIRTDTFTFTAYGRTWLDQQWGAQILFALAWRSGGWAAVALFRAVVTGGAFGLIYLCCRARGASARTSSLLAIGSYLVTAENLAERPQLIAVLLFSLCLWILSVRSSRPALLFAIPAITVVWANVHGSFFLAPALCGFVWLDDLVRRAPTGRRVLAVGLVCLPATLLNPFGWRVWAYVVDIATNPTISHSVSEWMPPTLRNATGIAFFVSTLVAVLILARRKGPTPWTSLLILGAFFALGLTAIRSTVWWGLVAPVEVAAMLPASDRRSRAGSPVLNLAVAAALVAAIVVTFPALRPSQSDGGSPLLSDQPVGLTRAIESRAGAGSNIFVAQSLASWFEFAVPDDKLFVDSRIELFPQSVWTTYLDASEGRLGWQQTMDRYHVGALVLTKSQTAGLQEAVAVDPVWKLVYHDADGWVYVRASG